MILNLTLSYWLIDQVVEVLETIDLKNERLVLKSNKEKAIVVLLKDVTSVPHWTIREWETRIKIGSGEELRRHGENAEFFHQKNSCRAN